MDAIKKGDFVALVQALNDGAEVELSDQHGYPGLPLRTAAFLGHATLVTELLRRGADPHAANADGPDAPLRMARRGGRDKVCAILLGNVPEAAGNDGSSSILPPLEFVSCLDEVPALTSSHVAVDIPLEPSQLPEAEDPSLMETKPGVNVALDVPAVELSAHEFSSREYIEEPTEPPESPEEVVINACYGVDTNVLDQDLLRLSTPNPESPPPSSPKIGAKLRFWQRE